LILQDAVFTTVNTALRPLDPMTDTPKFLFGAKEITDLFRPDDSPILDMIFKYNGAIFGGYLRDIILGIEPNDIDVVLSSHPNADTESFFEDIKSLGYKVESVETDFFRLSKEGCRDIEIVLSEDHPDHAILGPAAAPDFTVNLLVYSQQDGLNEWTGIFNDVDRIIEDILERKATQVSPDYELDEKRRTKIVRKGFTIDAVAAIST